MEVQSIVRMSVSILTLEAEPFAIGKCGLEPVEITSYDIHVQIGDQACQVLPHTLPHDAGLSVIHGEALFEEG